MSMRVFGTLTASFWTPHAVAVLVTCAAYIAYQALGRGPPTLPQEKLEQQMEHLPCKESSATLCARHSRGPVARLPLGAAGCLGFSILLAWMATQSASPVMNPTICDKDISSPWPEKLVRKDRRGQSRLSRMVEHNVAAASHSLPELSEEDFEMQPILNLDEADEMQQSASILLSACESQSEHIERLTCYAEIVSSKKLSSDELAHVSVTSKNSMSAIRRQLEAGHTQPLQSDAINQANSKWFSILRHVVKSQCMDSREELEFLRGAEGARSATVVQVVGALRRFADLEAPLLDMRPNAASKQVPVNDTDQDGKDITVCMLQALQVARRLVQALPTRSKLVQDFFGCSAHLFQPLERLVLLVANEAQDADVLFSLGAYWSEKSLDESGTTLFASSEDRWLKTGDGHYVPEGIARAEVLLLQGEQTANDHKKNDFAAIRALRLYKHAKFLAVKHHDAAAEWRYRESARVAISTKRKRLAAHSMTRLGYFLFLRGRMEESLSVSNAAIRYHMDPLALYLQVQLQRQFGKLLTSQEVADAEATLERVAGQLPSQALEDQRSSMLAEFEWWRVVSEGGIKACRTAWDAAQFVMCFVFGFAFKAQIFA